MSDPTPDALREELKALMEQMALAGDKFPNDVLDALQDAIEDVTDPTDCSMWATCLRERGYEIVNRNTLLAALSRDGGADEWRAGAEAGVKASIRYLQNAAEIYDVEPARGLALGLKYMGDCILNIAG